MKEKNLTIPIMAIMLGIILIICLSQPILESGNLDITGFDFLEKIVDIPEFNVDNSIIDTYNFARNSTISIIVFVSMMCLMSWTNILIKISGDGNYKTYKMINKSIAVLMFSTAFCVFMFTIAIWGYIGIIEKSFQIIKASAYFAINIITPLIIIALIIILVYSPKEDNKENEEQKSQNLSEQNLHEQAEQKIDEKQETEQKEANITNEKYCTKCGTKADKDDEFCRHCGAKLKKTS